MAHFTPIYNKIYLASIIHRDHLPKRMLQNISKIIPDFVCCIVFVNKLSFSFMKPLTKADSFN